MRDDTLDDEFSDETEEERLARESVEVILDELSMDFINKVIDKLMRMMDELSGHPLYEYQVPFARRIFESLIIDDGSIITALFSRQSGKSEVVANVVATVMIMFPILARVYPDLFGKYKEGVYVGAFAPVDEQADNLFSRIQARLTSERAEAIMADPEINDRVKGRGREIRLTRSGSLVRKTTCHPRATIEGRTYHLILIDECQGADTRVVDKSVTPMGASTNATMVWTGTPTYTKGIFYKQIQLNKRMGTKRGQRQNHFQADWKEAGKANPSYRKFVQKEMLRMGEDNDEFRLSYRLHWLLEKGMFTSSSQLDELGDTTMQSVVASWTHTPVVVGIDPARKQDSTVVTVVAVNWDRPDENGYYEHRILNWLDLGGETGSWEAQYYLIRDFLSNYDVWKIGIDVGGLGDVVADRLKVLMPRTEIVELGSQQPEQSARWKHLGELMSKRMISWPAGAKVRRLKTYRRFRQQMEDLEKVFKGPYMLAAAPNEPEAHDDYADSLALACFLTKDELTPTVEVADNFLYEHLRGR